MEAAQPHGYLLRKSKVSHINIRPVHLPKLSRHTSRQKLIDLERELQHKPERLVPLIQPKSIEYPRRLNAKGDHTKRRKRNSCNTRHNRKQEEQHRRRERFHTSQLYDQHYERNDRMPIYKSHYTNIDITVKEIKARNTSNISADQQHKLLPTESTELDNTLSSFERLINKNRDLIRNTRQQQKLQGYSKQASRLRSSIHYKNNHNHNHLVTDKSQDQNQVEVKRMSKNESMLFHNINQILQTRQKTETLRHDNHSSSMINSKRYNTHHKTLKNMPPAHLDSHNDVSGLQNRNDSDQSSNMRWRRVSLNSKNEIQMIESSFHEEIDKISRYESQTKDYLGKYVKNLEALMVLKLNDELRTRKSVKITDRSVVDH